MDNKRTFAVIGLGTFGMEVCREVASKGGRVIAIDKDQKRIDKLKDIVTQAILLDTTEEDSLNKTPLDTIDVAVVAIAEDIEASILSTALLKKYKIPYIIARSSSEIHSQILSQIGANEIINIEVEEGRRIANKLVSPNIIEQIPISGSYVFAEILVPPSFLGKTLFDLNIRTRYNISVVSIKRISYEVDDVGNPITRENFIFPGPNDRLLENDIIVVVGEEKNIITLKEKS